MNRKVLITGSTGNIGREVLLQLLQHPDITSVISLSRREISSSLLPNADKFQNVIVKDFSNWSQDIMDIIQDADAMFWGMGTNNTSPGPNKDWPLAFQDAMFKTREAQPRTKRFIFVPLSGRFVVQDQDACLWFLSKTRKLKGRYEIALLEFAKEHKDTWQTFIVKPGGVITPNISSNTFVRGLLSMLMGGMGIKSEELGAYVAELIATGKEEAGMISNERMKEQGRKLLKMKTKTL